uniref:Uncharacterized protein n=1 Tax=Glossina pallidipes TaxID=7398 RepID=A0A1A9ZQA1_GLOPL
MKRFKLNSLHAPPMMAQYALANNVIRMASFLIFGRLTPLTERTTSLYYKNTFQMSSMESASHINTVTGTLSSNRKKKETNENHQHYQRQQDLCVLFVAGVSVVVVVVAAVVLIPLITLVGFHYRNRQIKVNCNRTSKPGSAWLLQLKQLEEDVKT